ncbi:MAG: hypothetical protein ACRDRS_07165 [Pseudonocardiaceae bacterium]
MLEFERRGYIQAGPYNLEVAVDHPEAPYELHVEFGRAEAEVHTCYGGARHVLGHVRDRAATTAGGTAA